MMDEPRVIKMTGNRELILTHPNAIVDALGELIFEDKLAAETLLESLKLQMTKNRFVTIGDLKDLIGDPSTFIDHRWGWRDLSDFSVTEYEGDGAGEHSHQLNYPEPAQI